MKAIRTLLHATDFSPLSERAWELACLLARQCGARLIVLHVLERPRVVYSGVALAPPPPPPADEERQAAWEQLRRMQPPEAGVAVEHRLEEGDPATAILQVADEAAADLIILGTHGRTGLSRLLMGSIAEQVVRRATCPVLTVKTPLPSEPA
ncbi:MAG: universal stress protein [Gemmataceae bacterium]|nr:universal stress protein [Gemmataceae bacterium]MDW8267462.1 universal stress protein [Gemmataceae bacterium]